MITSLRHLRPDAAIRYCVYYGKDRTKYLGELDRYDLVITTYSVVRLDWKASITQPESARTLHSAKWGRIVLDEGKSNYGTQILLTNFNSSYNSRTFQVVC